MQVSADSSRTVLGVVTGREVDCDPIDSKKIQGPSDDEVLARAFEP